MVRTESILHSDLFRQLEEEYGSKCFIVLPCFNEEKNLKSLIFGIDRAVNSRIPYMVIAVNDGSTDYTADVLRRLSKEYPLELIHHERNMGLASALRTGLNAAIHSASEHDMIVVMDADNTHDPRSIVDMVEELRKGAGIVVASRYVKGGKQLNVPFYRILLSRTCNLLISKIAKMPVKDATSGYRCYRKSALSKAIAILGDTFIESNGFGVSLEILIKTYLGGVAIKEIPTTLHYGNKLGKSKMDLPRTFVDYFHLFRMLKKWQEKPVQSSW